MPKLAFNQALKNIEQGQFGLLYYLAGPEKYFHDRFIERLIAKVFADKGSRSLNLSLLYGSENTQQQLMAAVEGFPMLSDYKLVIVRDFEQMKISDADTFISYLNHPQKTTILVLGASKSASGKAFSELNRLAQVIECKAIPLRNISGWITDIERYALHDGPGIRTTIFLKGCPLRCRWCSNPETQAGHPQLAFFEERCKDPSSTP